MMDDTTITTELRSPHWCRSSHYAMLSLLLILSAAIPFAAANAQIVTGKMVTEIRAIIPQQDPYCHGGYPGITVDPNNRTLCFPVTVGEAIPQDVVDWVLIELRSTTSPSDSPAEVTTVVARKPAFLLSNGRVVDAQKYTQQIATAPQGSPLPLCEVAELATTEVNCPDVTFVQVDVGNDEEIYLVVRHRNHLDIISSSDITATDREATGMSDIYSYDFSNGENKAYNQSMALKDKGGILAMYGGDVDGDGVADLTDYTLGTADFIGTSLYHAADTNFGGIITPADYSDIIAHNIGQTSQVPIPAP